MKLEYLLGEPLYIYFLVDDGNIRAYAWHRDVERARRHLENIMEFHGLRGEIVYNDDMRRWLEDWVEKVVFKGEKFPFDLSMYRFGEVYRSLTEVERGSFITYSELARISGVKYIDVLKALMRNPFQVLIPCHRILTEKRSLMGFYPLGKDVKKRLLEIEGIHI